jgi:NAD(P)-dependent dehydrogenase (short-subunit alcohol dehydrogenase family)
VRTIILTGASDGIGAVASGLLASDDVRLVLVGRSPEKVKAVAAPVGAEWHAADFARLDEVRDLAKTLNASLDRVDVLANNAGGIFAGPATTTDGFEKTFQINHLAPFLLTHLLLDRLLESRAAVVATSSVGARLYGHIDFDDLQNLRGFRPRKAYGDAKLANILFTQGLHRRFHTAGLSAVAFHPGNIATNFASDKGTGFNRIYHGPLKAVLSSPQKGGANLAHFVAGTPGRDWLSGEYYGSNRRISRTNPQASDPATAERHWQLTEELLALNT